MMYFLYGDKVAGGIKAKKILSSQKLKDKDALHYRFDEETFNREAIQELAESSGLFQTKIIVILDGVFSNTTTREVAMDFIDTISESSNIFIVIEHELPKDIITKLEKKSEKTEKFESKKIIQKKKEAFPIFNLADALGQRDKKKLWELYREARSLGISSEEIHSILLWQAKSMFLASQVKSATEAGISPFVFTKSARYAKSFTDTELQNLMWKLLEIVQASRAGEDMDVSLEKCILEM